MKEETQEKDEREVDALCPECGHGFKAFVDRLLPRAGDAPEEVAVHCPVCGCNDCKIGK